MSMHPQRPASSAGAPFAAPSAAARPFAEPLTGEFHATSDYTLLTLSKLQVRQFVANVPQFSYLMRKYREQHGQAEVLWRRGGVEIG
jgi:hypothetical protein